LKSDENCKADPAHEHGNSSTSRNMPTLCHGDITPCLEKHHGNGMSGESVSNDKFSDDVEADLLISDGLDHADGDNVHKCWFN